LTELVRVSASQVQLASLCWRKWAFAYVYGLREPETWQLALGTLVHAMLQAYLRNGTVPDPNVTWTHPGSPRTFYPGKIALNMMPVGVFPAPGTGHVEHKFEFNDGEGVVWNGLLDWHLAHNFEITVIDHKTSSDPAQWGKLGDGDPSDDARALHIDPQAIIYARAMIDKYGDLTVRAHWNYGSTKHVASASRVATTRYTPEQARELFETRVQPVGREIRRLRLMNADPLSLEPNPDACNAYHKECPHVKTCNLTTAQRIGNIIMGNSLVDNLIAAAQNVGATPAPAAPPAPPVAPGVSVNPPEAVPGQEAPVVSTVPGVLPAAPTPPQPPVAPPQPPGAPPPPPVAPPQPPVAPPQPPVSPPQAAAPTPEPPKPATGKRGASKKKSQSQADNGLNTVLRQLGEIRPIDEELADAVAGKLADRIAEKLLGEL
jgi:hypothetical protein